MLKTYEAYLFNDRLKWVDEKPPHFYESKDIHVYVTILDSKPTKENQNTTDNLLDFFRASPFYDSDINLERDGDCGREVSF